MPRHGFRAIVDCDVAGFVKINLSTDDILAPHLAKAAAIVKNYSVIFLIDEEPVGSGTLSIAARALGISTAFHVAQHVMSHPQFVLCVSDSPHRLEIDSVLLEHIPVGSPPDGDGVETGPDLSFLVIKDPTLVAQLQKLRSFFQLDSARVPSFHPALGRHFWAVAGTYRDSFSRVSDDYQGGPLSRMTNFVGTGLFPFDLLSVGEFDYLKLTLPAGGFGFPESYKGLSGGGVWLIPMEADAIQSDGSGGKGLPVGDPSTIGLRAPVLVGVQFCQSKRESRERVLTAHGPNSLHLQLVQNVSRALRCKET
jgi:hypothetical protein